MSKTKTMTIDNLKTQESKLRVDKVILNNEEYIGIINRIYELQNELEKQSDENDINNQEILLLKNEIKNLFILCNNYKAEIENKELKDNALKKSLEQMEANQKKLNDDIDKSQKSKYSKISKEDLQRLAMERFNNFKSSINI